MIEGREEFEMLPSVIICKYEVSFYGARGEERETFPKDPVLNQTVKMVIIFSKGLE